MNPEQLSKLIDAHNEMREDNLSRQANHLISTIIDLQDKKKKAIEEVDAKIEECRQQLKQLEVRLINVQDVLG